MDAVAAARPSALYGGTPSREGAGIDGISDTGRPGRNHGTQMAAKRVFREGYKKE